MLSFRSVDYLLLIFFQCTLTITFCQLQALILPVKHPQGNLTSKHNSLIYAANQFPEIASTSSWPNIMVNFPLSELKVKTVLIMSFFLKGDFKIQESWEQKPPSRSSNSRNKGRQTEKNKSLVNAGKNILAQPSTDILDDQISKRILKDFAQEHSFGSAKMEKKHPVQDNSVKLPPRQKPQSETDLLASMASRLKNVQMTCKNQREQIKQKSQIIDKLKQQNAYLKEYKKDASGEYDKVKILEDQNTDLKSKIEEMEQYLKKYGLKWVGNKIQGKLEHQKMKKDIKSKYQYRLPSQIDITTIARRVEELNGNLHSQGMGTEVYQQNGVHKFKKSEPLPIGFFANGIAIKGYSFFPYKSKESLQILGDLVDGYFPYVLKRKYPNGVFLKVIDNVGETFNSESSEGGITTFDSNENKAFKPPSKQQFLSKLPEQVIKNGKVINIRGEIQKRLNGQSQKPRQKEQNQIFSLQDGTMVFKTILQKKLKDKIVDQTQICTLKIRNEQGQVYILHLQKEQKVNEIYTWMQKVTNKEFVLMSNFPRRSYEKEEKENLEQLGFYPNAMLHIHIGK